MHVGNKVKIRKQFCIIYVDLKVKSWSASIGDCGVSNQILCIQADVFGFSGTCVAFERGLDKCE